jgi:ribonuclease HI
MAGSLGFIPSGQRKSRSHPSRSMNARSLFLVRRLSVDQTYRIFTDGSAIGNPGSGGWGAVLMQGKRRWEMSGAFLWTTISEMELVAAVQALRPLPDQARVVLHSDSEYLIYGMRVFVYRWQRQSWRNRRGIQLQHRELWSELITLNARLHIRWTWIKGHNGNLEQARADTLAYQAARAFWARQKAAA